jgi:hypothetical protein
VACLHSEAEAALAKSLKEAEEKHNHHMANTITALHAANTTKAKLQKDIQVRHPGAHPWRHCKVGSALACSCYPQQYAWRQTSVQSFPARSAALHDLHGLGLVDRLQDLETELQKRENQVQALECELLETQENLADKVCILPLWASELLFRTC